MRLRLWIAYGLAGCLLGCSTLPMRPNDEAIEQPIGLPDPVAEAQAWRTQGYDFYLFEDGTRLRLSQAVVRTMFQNFCDNRRLAPPCDERPNYLIEVTVHEYTNVFFVHKDGMDTEFLPTFACSNTNPGWRCQAEQH